MFNQLRDDIYNEMSKLAGTHKHARELDRQKLNTLYECLDLVDQLESKLLTCKLQNIKASNLRLEHLETVEFDSFR